MQEAGHSLGAGGPLTKFKRQMSLTTKGCITPSGMEEQLRSVSHMLPLQAVVLIGLIAILHPLWHGGTAQVCTGHAPPAVNPCCPVLVCLVGVHKTGCSGETWLVLHVPSSS